MEIYERLREILDAHPATAPKTKSIDEILRTLFTPEEAALAVKMSYKTKSVGSIAKAAGVADSKAKKNLESMADKGIIYSKNKEGEKFYGLLPLIPGVFEFPFMKGGGTPMHKRLGQLWEEYHREALGVSLRRSKISSEMPITSRSPNAPAESAWLTATNRKRCVSSLVK